MIGLIGDWMDLCYFGRWSNGWYLGLMGDWFEAWWIDERVDG